MRCSKTRVVAGSLTVMAGIALTAGAAGWVGRMVSASDGRPQHAPAGVGKRSDPGGERRADAQGMWLVGQVGGPTRAVATIGDTAYVGRGPRVHAYAACDPAAPIHVGASEVLPGPVLDLLPSAPFLYAALGEAGLAVFDISDPWRMPLVRVVPLYGVSARLVPQGDRLYVVSGYGGLRILSVADPAAPRELGHFQAVVSDVAVRGRYAYVVKRDFTVVDVSDPTAPDQIRKLADWADSVALEGTTLVAAVSSATGGAAREGALRVFDVSDPWSPRARGDVPIGPPARLLRFAEGLLVAFQPANGRVVDVGDPDRPRDLFHFPARGNVTGMAGAVAEAGHLHFLLASGPHGLRSIDVGPVGDPGYRGEAWADETLADAQALAVADGIAYVEDEGGGERVRVYDLREPGRPHEMAQLHVGVAHGAMAADSGKLYVGDSEQMLRVADVSDPGRPRLVGRIGLPQPIWDLAAEGDRVAVAADEHVRVFDVSRPEAPVEVGSARASGGATAIAMNGAVAYVTGPSTGLEPGRPSLMAFEVARAARPRELGVMPDAAGWRHGLATTDGIVYVGGLQVVDATSPGAMREVGRLGVEGETRALAAADGRLYAALRLPDGGRLVEVDITSPAAPSQRAALDLVDEALDVAEWQGYVLVAAKEAGLWIIATDRALPPPTVSPPQDLAVVVYLPVAAVGPVGVPCRPGTGGR